MNIAFQCDRGRWKYMDKFEPRDSLCESCNEESFDI